MRKLEGLKLTRIVGRILYDAITLHRYAFILLSPLLLQSCLFQALWKGHDAEKTHRITSNHTCQVQAMHGQLGSQDSETGNVLVLEFYAHQDRYTPPDLQGCTPATPGYLQVSPKAALHADWLKLPGADQFTPQQLQLRTYRSDFFRQGWHSARLLFQGQIPTDQVGTVQRKPSIKNAAAVRGKPAQVFGPSMLERCKESFFSQSWSEVFALEGHAKDYSRQVLGFIDKQGQAVSEARVTHLLESPQSLNSAGSAADSASDTGPQLADIKLLGFMQDAWGNAYYLRIPMAVLVQGKDLQLQPSEQEGMVQWSREQIWTAAVKRNPELLAGLAKLDMQLAQQQFQYIYAQEVSSQQLLPTMGRLLLSPPALALDFVLLHSSFMQGIIEIIRQGEWHGPIPPKQKN